MIAVTIRSGPGSLGMLLFVESWDGMDRYYLVRYGLNGAVGRFAADEEMHHEPGRTVVIRSWRGTELGEILIALDSSTINDADRTEVEGLARILRTADAGDLERARKLTESRDEQFAQCAPFFQDGTWPIELIDVEPLLDDRRVVLHYLGPHKLDTAGLLGVFRTTCGLDVMFQAVGLDVDEDSEPDAETHGCGSCGSKSAGCGSGKSGSTGGCGSCAVKSLLANRR